MDAAPSRLERLAALVRVSSVRFAAFYFAAFYTALLATGHGGPRWIALSVALCAVGCAGIELTNRYADQIEDAANRPERTALCRVVGFETIRAVATGIHGALLLVYLVWFAYARKVDLFVIQMLSWLIAWNYSVGMRFKARRHGVLVVLSGTFLLPFLFGWTIFGSIRDVPPAILCVPVFVASISGVKDITDEEGDARRGYRSLLLEIARRRSLRGLLLLLVSPYALVLALCALGYAPPRMLLTLVMAPISLVFALLIRGARGESEAASVREAMYHFWFLFLLVTLLLLVPTWHVAAALVGTTLYWVFATRRLHWAVGLRRDQAIDILRILARTAS